MAADPQGQPQGQPVKTDMVNLRKMYDSFPNRNMSFSEFAKEMKSLADPEQIKKDLDTVMVQRAIRRTNQIRAEKEINKAIKNKG